MRKRVVVCMSGGVDSTVAALLLKESGHDVAGLTFWFWSFPGAPDYQGRTKCCSLEEVSLAADEVGIPHETIDASDAFHNLVLRDFVDRYRAGETPNPCGRCNRLLRFGRALQYARDNGFDAVATGHHVRIVEEEGGLRSLCRGADPAKDQSYFLYGLGQEDLARLAFPVGDRTKPEVVEIARAHGLTCADLPESQDLCFALAGDTAFLFDESDLRTGLIVDLDGRRLGTHNGLPNYTIGQRRGLGIAAERPLYVVDIDPAANRLVVGGEDALVRSDLTAIDANYISGTPPEAGARVEAKIRYRSPPSPAHVCSATSSRFDLGFREPQRAITPGQIAAIYRGDCLLGGGTIGRSERSSRHS
jgi:tRNA-specific 2-thiouridylase